MQAHTLDTCPPSCRGSAVAHGLSCLGRRHPGTSLAPLLHLRSEWDLGSLQGLTGTRSRAAAELFPPLRWLSTLELSPNCPNLGGFPRFCKILPFCHCETGSQEVDV